ncbi:hypothetical protein Tco_0183115 [Tanacetum coccineum]
MASKEEGDLVSQLVDLVKVISGLPDCRNASRKMYGSLMRRVKLLSPLFEEIKDGEKKDLDDGDLKGFNGLIIALNLALELLKSVNDGSKIFQENLCYGCLTLGFASDYLIIALSSCRVAYNMCFRCSGTDSDNAKDYQV